MSATGESKEEEFLSPKLKNRVVEAEESCRLFLAWLAAGGALLHSVVGGHDARLKIGWF
jgi:hypothetical protein